MIEYLEKILCRLFAPGSKDTFPAELAPDIRFHENDDTPAGVVNALNSAFLVTLSGHGHPDVVRAEDYIQRMSASGQWSELAGFYRTAKTMVHDEIESMCRKFPDVGVRLKVLCDWLSDVDKKKDAEELIEKMWSFFFPEGTGIYEAHEKQITELRAKRAIKIKRLNPQPLTHPGRQLLFTSNVLLTIPDSKTPLEGIPLSNELKDMISQAMDESQMYWYDHPIQIGVRPEQNEVLYGLHGLCDAVAFERRRGNMDIDRITCILSVSVTHQGLKGIARQYIEEEVFRYRDDLDMDVYVFTEADAATIIDEILIPAAEHYKGQGDVSRCLAVLGVDGEYGRHYNFLKAMAAFWNILIDANIKGTFKIDLDQTFPQEELVAQTKASAFDHFKTPLWGASGVDSDGKPAELGMIAGALVNEQDMVRGLFTSDVAFPPERPQTPEDMIFYSSLPQALSTEAEMMTHYNTVSLDGENTCIQRIHVTGGTNGILVESLRRHRPFTPSFIGRAEDQAYILSVLNRRGKRLVYVHKDGLIMRHDKEAFARDAIRAASAGKIVGDYIRTLLFSQYADVLGEDIKRLKRSVDPFTGCFISIIPITVVMLRFCLRTFSLFKAGESIQGYEFVTMGALRIRDAIYFISGENSLLRQAYRREKESWSLYYDILSILEEGLKKEDPFVQELQKKAKSVVAGCLIKRHENSK